MRACAYMYPPYPLHGCFGLDPHWPRSYSYAVPKEGVPSTRFLPKACGQWPRHDHNIQPEVPYNGTYLFNY